MRRSWFEYTFCILCLHSTFNEVAQKSTLQNYKFYACFVPINSMFF